MDAVLTDEGYEVLLAANAQQALKVTSARLPDIVLTDLEMPGGGGETLIQHLRANGHHELPIVGVQWHPEMMTTRDVDPIFRWLIESAVPSRV